MADSETFVTHTKVIVPRRRADLLSRQRLNAHLQTLLHNRLIAVTAPAGCGKTSLLIDVAHQTSLPVCWFSIDPFDNNLYRFVNHFFGAISTTFADLSDNLRAAENLNFCALAGLTVNAVFQHINTPFVLIIDDFHLITNPDVIAFVDLFLQQVDDNCRLVVSSRELITLPNGLLLVGRSDIAGLGPRDLAFRPEEIQTLLLQNYRCSISMEAAIRLARQTEGWITGLLLSMQTLLENVANRFHQAQISGQPVYDYLANQVLEQQPASVQDFLLRTSLLDEFNANLCETIFGPASYSDGHTWQTLTQLLVQNNLFVLPVDGRETWFRYHQLFRDFLQNRITQKCPTEFQQILKKIAQFNCDNGDWEKAQVIFVQLSAPDAVANLIEHTGLQLVRSGRFKSLETWIKTLPVQQLNHRPMVMAFKGYAAIVLGQTKHALTLLNRAEAAFKADNDLAGLARTLAWRAGANRLLGNYRAALQDANQALWLAQSATLAQSLHALAQRALAQSLLTVRRSEEALRAFETSLALYKELSDDENVARLNLETGVAYLTLGRYEKAECHFDLALNHYSKTGNAIRLADLFNNWGVLHYQTGNYQKSVEMFEQTLDYARQSDYVRLEAYALCGIGDIYFELEAFDAAEDAYKQAHRIVLQSDEQYILLHLELAKVSLARKRNDLPLAGSLLNFARQTVTNGGSDYEHGLFCIEAGLLALTENRFEEAETNLRDAIAKFNDDGRQLEKARAYLYLACTSYSLDQRDIALQHLQTAITLVSALGTLQPLVAVGGEAVSLLEYARQQCCSITQADQLLAQINSLNRNIPGFRRVLRRQTLAVPLASSRLSINLLGKPRILLDGQIVSAPEWTHRQARQLFYYLLAEPLGGTSGMIGCQLWPNCSTRELKWRFKNALRQIRRVFGKNSIIRDEDSGYYVFNRKLDYEYDVELFEWYLVQARNTAAPHDSLGPLQTAIKLYHGPFLSQVDNLWVLPERQRLHYLFVNAHLKLAEIFLEAGNFELALEHGWSVLKIEASHERAHRLVMKTYAAIGDRGAVVRQFKACIKALRDEVDAPVSAETRALYAALLY